MITILKYALFFMALTKFYFFIIHKNNDYMKCITDSSRFSVFLTNLLFLL